MVDAKMAVSKIHLVTNVAHVFAFTQLIVLLVQLVMVLPIR